MGIEKVSVCNIPTEKKLGGMVECRIDYCARGNRANISMLCILEGERY